MITQTILDQITLCADGSIGLRFLKQVLDDTGNIMFSEPHRSVIDPDAEPGDQMIAVNNHLTAMGYTAVPAAALGHVEKLKNDHRKFAPVVARVKAFKEAKEAERLRQEELLRQLAAAEKEAKKGL